MRNKRDDIITVSTDTKRIKMEQYEQLYANKSDPSDEMDKFLEKHKLSKFTEEVSNFNHLLSIKLNFWLKTFPEKKL